MQAPVVESVSELADELVDLGFGPFYGTPCGILAPLLAAIDRRAGLHTVVREDNAVGMAAGAALAGRLPVVLMQNSGLGQSVNAIASLVAPYRLPVLLIVSMRGTPPDPTQENEVMGRLTESLLAGLGVRTRSMVEESRGAMTPLAWAHGIVARQRGQAAVLVPPTTFAWQP